MAFRFALESVLKHRKRQEEIAHREHVEARAQLEDCLSGIDQMYSRIDETRQSIADAEHSGRRNSIAYICESQSFIEAQKIRIRGERQKARELIRVLEEKEHQLLERLHDRKIIEKLKDKRLQEYEERLALFERKELDDLTNARHAIGGRR